MNFKYKISILDEIINAINSKRGLEEIELSKEEYQLLLLDNRFNAHPCVFIEVTECKTIYSIPIKIKY